MKKILFILTLFCTLVYSNETNGNPKVYSALGNKIYNNIPKIKKLKDITIYKYNHKKIDKYIEDVEKLKRKGFLIQDGLLSIDKHTYLNGLRDLAKRNDTYVRSARSIFNNAINTDDSKTFSKIINTGLIDTKRNKNIILNYYFSHQNELKTNGVIQHYLDEDNKLRKIRELRRKNAKTKKQLQEEKIKRIRKNDKLSQAKLEKKIDAEVNKKKEEIINEQKSELFN